MAEEKKEEIAVIEITEEYMKERIYEIRGQRVISVSYTHLTLPTNSRG